MPAMNFVRLLDTKRIGVNKSYPHVHLAVSIPLLTWDNPTYPPSGINDITITSGDQVYVNVEDRLT